MPRRKRFLDDGDDSDSNDSEVDFDAETDPIAREERELFENPYQHKRRRKNGKEDALYGIFGEDSEDEDLNLRKSGKKSDWTKAPAFISGDTKVDLDREMDLDLEEGVEKDCDDEDAD
ncbi:hypothetical protein C0995_001111, partial [Termitomyces sp. Mi166